MATQTSLVAQQKKAIYERYKEGLKDLPVSMNPMDLENSEPNYWLSCLIIDKEAMCKQVRGEQDVCYLLSASRPGFVSPRQKEESEMK